MKSYPVLKDRPDAENQQPDKGSNTEAIEDDDSGCYMCFALLKVLGGKQFTERLQYDEH